MFTFRLAQLYSYIYGIAKHYFNFHIRGLGFILRRVKVDRRISVFGRHLWFDHRLAEAYARPLSGSWNEPETHRFISLIFSGISNSTFIEVGGNIGEILVDVASHSNSGGCIVFEPNPQCVEVIIRNVAINSLKRCQIIPKAVGDKTGSVKMYFGSHSPTASVLSPESKSVGIDVELTTLDHELEHIELGDNVLLLVDVEGYEPQVLRGAAALIKEKRPLIIFEYNEGSKEHYKLSEIQDLLGAGYQIYRLRTDAYLDEDVENAWNCVAIPCDSVFQAILRRKEIFNR